MIRTTAALSAILKQGRTVARLAEMAGETKWRWVMADTNEPVHRQTINRLIWAGEVAVVASDLCGDPIQLGRSGKIEALAA